MSGKVNKMINRVAVALATAATEHDATVSPTIAAKLTGGYKEIYLEKKTQRIKVLLEDAWDSANNLRRAELRKFWQAIIDDDPKLKIKIVTEDAGIEVLPPKKETLTDGRKRLS